MTTITASVTANAATARNGRRSESACRPNTAAVAPKMVKSSALLMDLLPIRKITPRQGSTTGK
jgi:hypothetical protein